MPINYEAKDRLAKMIFGISPIDAWKQKVCINCQQPAETNCYSEAGKEEYWISGLCEHCFDQITQGTRFIPVDFPVGLVTH